MSKLLISNKATNEVPKKTIGWEWGISTPQPEGIWPFFAPRALPGRPRAVECSSRPDLCSQVRLL